MIDTTSPDVTLKQIILSEKKFTQLIKIIHIWLIKEIFLIFPYSIQKFWSLYFDIAEYFWQYLRYKFIKKTKL